MQRSRLLAVPAIVAIATLPALSTLTSVPVQAAASTPPGQQNTDTLFPSQGNSGYDVRRYRVDLDYTPASNQLAAQIAVRAKASRSLTSFNLDFSGPQLSSVDVDGAAAATRRRGHELTITPATPIKQGATFTATIAYTGSPSSYTDADHSTEGWVRTSDGAIALGEPVGAMTWLPCNNTPADKALYSYRITVPTGYQAVANGNLRDTVDNGATTTYRWRADEPMATYLAMVAIGRFKATTASYTSIDGRKIPIRNYVDTTAAATGSGSNLARLPQVLAAEEKWFGPYPFSAAGGVVDDASVGYALETQTRPFYPTSGADLVTIVHETAHQWFGDSVTLKDWHDIWLAEGFATYAEWLWTGTHGGNTPQQNFDALYAKPASDSLWHPAPRRFTDSADLFGEPVYNRGAMTLQVLRNRIGTKAFFSLLKTWTADLEHHNATTATFVKLAEKISGKNLDGMFETWLDTDGKPASPR